MKSKEVEFEEIIDVLTEKLERGGTVTFTPHGKSMEPMLRDGQDVVVLEKPKGRLHFGDVALYRRSDGRYVLHRVVDFGGDGSYIFCGDNNFSLEYGVEDKDIIAVMTAFYRKGKAYRKSSPKYRLYRNFWYYTRYIRKGLSASKRRIIKLTNSKKDTESNGNEKES